MLGLILAQFKGGIMLVRVSCVLCGLFVAGQVFGGEEQLEGFGGVDIVEVQASYVSEWKPLSDAAGEFVFMVQAGVRRFVINISVSPQDEFGKFTVATSVDGDSKKVGSGKCNQSDYGFGNRYLLRYDLWGDALAVEEPVVCDLDFTVRGRSFKLRKVYYGDSIILIDGSVTTKYSGEILNFEIMTSSGEDSLMNCGTDSEVEDCYGGGF